MANAQGERDRQRVPLLIKADVGRGSAESDVQAIGKIRNDEVRRTVLHSGVGVAIHRH